MNTPSFNPVFWFEIYVDDMDRAKAFYETVLDVSLTKIASPELEMWSFPGDPSVPGSNGALARADGVAAGGNSTMVYFGCEDCAVEAARVDKAGGKLVREKMSIGEYGFVALAEDSEGNRIGLHSMK